MPFKLFKTFKIFGGILIELSFVVPPGIPTLSPSGMFLGFPPGILPRIAFPKISPGRIPRHLFE